jgi:dienelactone hydrolase
MRFVLALTVLLCSAVASGAVHAATAPPQPEKGPGGSDYAVKDVVKRAVGLPGRQSFVFHRADTGAEKRPVVIFLHAWGATNPAIYGGWIDHLARKGALVVFPRFQEPNRTRPPSAMPGMMASLTEAFAQLASDAAARPDTSRVVVVGHLAGAALAANYAASAEGENLPVPRLIFGVTPGGIASDAKSRGILLSDLSKVPGSTLLATMIGDREHLPSDRAARRLHRETTQIPGNRKIFVRILSDDHGFPSLSATLASPGSLNDAYDGAKIPLPPEPTRDPKAPKPRQERWSADMALTGEQTILVAQLNQNATDTLDQWGYWKTLDFAMATAFADSDFAALRKDGAFFDMGRWSDGWPVKRLNAEAQRDTPR